eukprot:m.5327 g.5327  ORF g.5327 m.5327 type:complete len:620 (+) comp3275_c0_seq1:2-1861(+)
MAEPPAKKQRTAKEPVQSVRPMVENCISKIRDGMKEVQSLKKDKKDIREKVVAMLLLFVDLKRLVRQSFENVDSVSGDTSHTKEQVDSLHLQLQNLLYQKIHIQNESRRCYQFRSRHDDIDLISEEEFFKACPEHKELKDDPHKLMIVRLEHEDRERKRLSEAVKKLKEQKNVVAKANDAKQDQLSRLPTYLKQLLEMATPMETIIGGENIQLIPEDSPARFLPTPLYVLYTNLCAYEKIGEVKFKLQVEGDVEKAKELLATLPTLGEEIEDVEKEGDDDGVNEDEDDSRRRQDDSNEQSMEAKKEKLLQLHPLSVDLRVSCANDVEVCCQLRYLPQLKVVVVSSDEETHGNILASLYPGDQGLELPHPGALYAADAVKMNSFPEYVKTLGRAYRWAQIIAGIQVIESVSDSAMRSRRQSLVLVLKAICDRVAAVKSLSKQLESLENTKINIPSDADVFPLEAKSKFKSWKTLKEDGDKDTQYEAVFERKVGKTTVCLQAIITVSKYYPLEPPQFGLSMKGGDKSALDANVVAMEAEVNVYYEELIKSFPLDMLLSFQLRRLQMCLDIYCETENDIGGHQSGLGKMFIRGVRGRERLRPYLFDPQQCLFIHRNNPLKLS